MPRDVIDTVILAGGRGKRLSNVVPEFYKPLVRVNGKALVTQAAEHALHCTGGRVVVVAAPENTVEIHKALPDDPRISIVVQRHPRGPGSALLRGLDGVTSDAAMVLLADNLMTREDVLRVTGSGYYTVAVREVPLAEAQRFTRVMPDRTTRESEPLRDDELADPTALVWVGPLVIHVEKAREVLAASETNGGEYKIGPWIPFIAPEFDIVHVDSCWDVGVPEALEQVGGAL